MIYHIKIDGLKVAFVTAKLTKMEDYKRYRYRPAEGYIHRSPPIPVISSEVYA